LFGARPGGAGGPICNSSRPVSKERQPARVPRRRLRVVGRPRTSPPPGGGPITLHKEEIELHGRRVAYRIGGWGPLLVLIHGSTSNSATWDRVLPKLTKRYTVLAPDLLGHGRSDKPRGDYSVGAHANTIRDLLDALGYRRATLVGHSLGGGVAMQVAYQYPDRVERLALVAPGGFGREVSIVLRAASVPGSGPVLALAAWRPIVQAGTLLAQVLGQVGVSANTDLEEVGRAYALLADRRARLAFIHTLRAVVDPRGQRVSALERLDVTKRVPSLIVWGGRDRIVPAHQGRRVHELVPNTYLAVFERAGHFPHRDDPRRFVKVLDEFLAREWGLRTEKRAALGA
jgi:pimeloyl-ACP methyl ester carboxylesterase